MGDKTVTIQFPPVSGLVKRGAFSVGKKYSVPQDVATVLVREGALLVTLAEKEEPEPLGNEHIESFAVVRAVEARHQQALAAEKADKAKSSAPPAAAAASTKVEN